MGGWGVGGRGGERGGAFDTCGAVAVVDVRVQYHVGQAFDLRACCVTLPACAVAARVRADSWTHLYVHVQLALGRHDDALLADAESLRVGLQILPRFARLLQQPQHLRGTGGHHERGTHITLQKTAGKRTLLGTSARICIHTAHSAGSILYSVLKLPKMKASAGRPGWGLGVRGQGLGV